MNGSALDIFIRGQCLSFVSLITHIYSNIAYSKWCLSVKELKKKFYSIVVFFPKIDFTFTRIATQQAVPVSYCMVMQERQDIFNLLC